MMQNANLLCFVLDIEVNQTKGFDPTQVGYDTVFAIRRRQGFTVFHNACPHTGRQLNLKRDNFLSPDRKSIMCYGHGARFAFDGTYQAGPCPGQFLRVLASHISENGYLFLDELPPDT